MRKVHHRVLLEGVGNNDGTRIEGGTCSVVGLVGREVILAYSLAIDI